MKSRLCWESRAIKDMEPYGDTIHNFVHFSLFNVSCGVLDVVVNDEVFNSTPSVSSLNSLDEPSSTQK